MDYQAPITPTTVPRGRRITRTCEACDGRGQIVQFVPETLPILFEDSDPTPPHGLNRPTVFDVPPSGPAFLVAPYRGDRDGEFYTDEEVDEMLVLRELGYENAQIALALGRSLSSVATKLTRLVETAPNSGERWTLEEDAILFGLRRRGKTYVEIAEILGRTVESVRYRYRSAVRS